MFIREAELESLTVDKKFSGPFMETVTCPAVRVASLKTFKTNARGAQWTKDGDTYIIYCPPTYWG